MQFITPDILVEGRGFTVPFSIAGMAVGLLLWLTGWWGHRFWIVLVTTVAAGVFGLLKGPVFRVQPVVAGLLLAVAAGVLALALVRVMAFAAGGFAAWLAVHTIAPAPWNEPLVCFLAGGLIGLLLFRIWTMVLTSFAGTVVMGYFGLWLGDHLGKLDAVALATEQPTLLNWACAGVGLVGFGVQYWIDRRRLAAQRRRLEREQYFSQKRHYDYRRWWEWGRRSYRRAG